MNGVKYSAITSRTLRKIIAEGFCRCRHGYAASLTEYEQDDHELQAKYKPLDKLPVKLPLVKNLFRAKIDTDLLAFPEFLGEDRVNLLEKNSEAVRKFVEENIDSSRIDQTGRIPDDVIQKLGQLKLFGLSAPRSMGGAEFTHTERARIMEILGRDPSVATLLFNQDTLGHKLIARYGDDKLKDKYLRPLITGKMFSALCFGEAESGSDAPFLNTYAFRTGPDWLLNGSKVWVINAAKADLFIVFAKVKLCQDEEKNPYYKKNDDDDDELSPEDVGIFLVEKNAVGLTVGPPMETTGLRGVPMCEVQFEDTLVPASLVLADFRRGYDIVKELLSADRYLIGSLALGILNNVQRDVTRYAIKRKMRGESLYKLEMVQERISKMAIAQYAIESVVYFTTGLMDLYDGQDCEVENAIVKVFSTEMAFEAINEALSVVGGQAFLQDFHFDRSLRDSRFLWMMDHNNDLYRCFISLNCLQYISNDINDMVVANRNPFFYPFQILKRVFRIKHFRDESDDPVLYLKIKNHLHPSLMYLADLLEYCILRLETGVNMTMDRLGPGSVNDQMYMKRMADGATLVYAMLAVLSRASRSYCIGSKHADEELVLAESFVRDSHFRFKWVVDGLIGGEYYVTDHNLKKIAYKTVEKDGYFITEPLKLTF